MTSTNGSGNGPEGCRPGLRDNPCPILGQQGGVVLVGHSDDPMEREDGTVEGDRPDHVSNQGWGASCLGTTTGGPWSPQERKWHINCLELLAATLALKTFVKDKMGVSVLLRIDNTNGSCLYQQSRRDGIQTTCLLDQGLVDVVPGEEHSHPSTTSTRGTELYGRFGVEIHDRSVRLENVSRDLQQTLWPTGSGPRLTNQCHCYFSWRPDPYAEATDAFLQDWTAVKGFANPPWNLISRVLTKTQTQEVDVVLLAPVWKAQPWYPLLLSMLVDWPRLLPKQLIRVHSQSILLDSQLAVWNIEIQRSRPFRPSYRTYPQIMEDKDKQIL